MIDDGGLERKFHRPDAGLRVEDDNWIAGYASLFGAADQGGDVVRRGAYAASLERPERQVKMLWQHDPTRPIGVWEELREDARGLWVRGRLLPEVAQAREALALIAAGALDGLSIGYRTSRASRDAQGRRVLEVVDLWEVSLVTFPMLPQARVGGRQAKQSAPADEAAQGAGGIARAFDVARSEIAEMRQKARNSRKEGR
ncbi:MAG: HK97 family phage prohead protease [Celeribacter sp.]|jgi:HK97 family phage prohead protease